MGAALQWLVDTAWTVGHQLTVWAVWVAGLF